MLPQFGLHCLAGSPCRLPVLYPLPEFLDFILLFFAKATLVVNKKL